MKIDLLHNWSDNSSTVSRDIVPIVSCLQTYLKYRYQIYIYIYIYSGRRGIDLPDEEFRWLYFCGKNVVWSTSNHVNFMSCQDEITNYLHISNICKIISINLWIYQSRHKCYRTRFFECQAKKISFRIKIPFLLLFF